jgi:hypothetical protein
MANSMYVALQHAHTLNESAPGANQSGRFVVTLYTLK